MPDEKRDEDIVDEMPDTDGAPCGDIFGAPGATHITDADADIISDDTEA